MTDKHTWLAETVLPKSNAYTHKKRKNVESIQINKVTRKTKFVLCILGCWGVYFPPYNLARLSALTREAGYHTTVFDFNVESYHLLKPVGLDEAWDSNRFYWWERNFYYDRIHTEYEPFLRTFIDRILAEDPDVLGLSIYATNFMPSEWLATEIKKIKPNIKIIAGGPNCHAPEYIPCDAIDHYIAGEGEQVLLDFLENVENNIPVTDRKLGSAYSDKRIDIDSLPFPDYTDYDFSRYISPGGISAEISRGCVAKCSFCTETWFWKYRDRDSIRILDEIEYQYTKHEINFVWFIDSLTNGNLKELRNFAKGVVERNLKITWMGYARCDGRMDLPYYEDLKASGCKNLSYGIESGSQKVLDLMRKNITIDEVNENLINAKKVGIFSHANWIVGAPGEDIVGMVHSMNLIWNHRNNIGAISPGMTLGDAKQTDYEFNRDRYGMSPWDKTICGRWWSLDWTNTKIHRSIRLKLFNVWLDICRKQHGIIENVQYRPKVNEFYTLKFDNDLTINDNVPYENFDHLIMKTNNSVFTDTVVNEIWGIARLLWRIKGGFEFTTFFDPVYDVAEFGGIADNYAATHYIKVDDEGNFTAKHTYKFIHKDEWWMKGNLSFDYIWEGSGNWDSTGVTHLEVTKSEGNFNSITETLPLDANYSSKFINKGTTKKVLWIESI
jgi:hypothetical protein